MTPEEQNIAIAEAYGWIWHHCPTSNIEIDRFGQLLKLGSRKWTGWLKGKHHSATGHWHQTYIPDYIHDLNASHEAEGVLTDNQWHRYVIEMEEIMERDAPESKRGNRERFFMNATASQRSEAFLRTIGKWKDAP